MPRIVSKGRTATSVAASFAATNPSHATGDLILHFLSQDRLSDTTTAIAAPAGWSMIGTQANSQGCRSAFAYKVAASGAEADPTFTGANEDWICDSLVVRGAGASPTIGWQRIDWGDSSSISSASSNTGIGASSNSGSAIVAPDKALMIVGWSTDCGNNTVQLRCPVGDLTGDSINYSSVAVAHCLGHRQLGASATVPAVSMYSDRVSEGGNGWVLTIAPDDAEYQADCHADVVTANYYGTHGALSQTVTWQAPSVFAASINGITCSTTAPTVTTPSAATDEIGNFTLLSHIENLARWQGGFHAFSPGAISGYIGSLHWYNNLGSSPRLGDQGFIIGFTDGTYWVTFKLCEKALAVVGQELVNFFACGGATEYANSEATSSSSIDWDNLTGVAYLWHRVASSTVSGGIAVKNLFFLGQHTIIGGSATVPATYKTAVDTLKSWGAFNLLDKYGSRLYLNKASLQIGNGGDITTTFDGSATALDYPLEFDSTDADARYWNAGSSVATITIYPGSADTLDMSASILGSPLQQSLEIHAGASTSSTVDFQGQSITQFAFTGKTGFSHIGATWSSCGTLDFAGMTLTNELIKLPTGTEAAICSANGATWTGCETDVSGSAADYHIALGASVTAITLTNHIFTGSAVTDKIYTAKAAGTVTAGSFVVGEHYEIKTVGTTDFTAIGASANTIGVQFTATGVGTGTGDAYKALKIIKTGTTSLADTDVTTVDGVKVWIAGDVINQEVVVTGFRSGSMIQLYDVDYTFDVSGTPPSVYPSAGDTYTDDTYGYVYTVISAGSGAIHTYGRSSAAITGTLTRTSGSGDASIAFIGCTDNGTELFKGSSSSGATTISGSTLTWTDPLAATANRYIRLRRGYVTASDADIWLEKIIGVCGTTSSDNAISYLDAPDTDSVYVTNGKDGPTGLASGNYTFTDTSPDLVTLNASGLGGTGSWKTLYAVFQAWLSSSTGISDDFAMMFAIDTATYRAYNTRIKVPLGESLQMTEGYCTDAVTGLSITLWDSTGGSIAFAGEGGYAYSSGSGLSPEQAAELSAAAAKPSAATISNQIFTDAVTTPIHSDPRKFKGLTIGGTGVPPTYDADGVQTDPGDPFTFT